MKPSQIAKEIISVFRINENIPYTYDGKNYLSAEDVIKMIIKKWKS